jgi:hypothetical protein
MNAPPDDELKELIALEKAAETDPGAARQRLALRLAPLLNANVPLKPHAPASLPRLRGWRLAALKGLGLFGAGAGVGAGLHAARQGPPRVEIRYVDRIVEVERDTEPSDAAPAPAAPAPSAREVAPRTPTLAVKMRGVSDADLTRERQIIDRAHAALARHDADSALAAVNEHAAAFPHGRLMEMREALAVQALVTAGREKEARGRAVQFHQAFPASMFSPVVDAALGSIP